MRSFPSSSFLGLAAAAAASLILRATAAADNYRPMSVLGSHALGVADLYAVGTPLNLTVALACPLCGEVEIKMTQALTAWFLLQRLGSSLARRKLAGWLDRSSGLWSSIILD
ncbi:hypothetical protein FB451DRAFT_1192539 [Mycena latifolia]|nr:hypothetical protein FB451DRAFT_1192539 [Mycena latifolia]